MWLIAPFSRGLTAVPPRHRPVATSEPQLETRDENFKRCYPLHTDLSSAAPIRDLSSFAVPDPSHGGTLGWNKSFIHQGKYQTNIIHVTGQQLFAHSRIKPAVTMARNLGDGVVSMKIQGAFNIEVD